MYLGIESGKLRYFTAEGGLVPTPEETALQAQLELQQQSLELEQQSLELQQERQRAERLAERLRELGVDLE